MDQCVMFLRECKHHHIGTTFLVVSLLIVFSLLFQWVWALTHIVPSLSTIVAVYVVQIALGKCNPIIIIHLCGPLLFMSLQNIVCIM